MMMSNLRLRVQLLTVVVASSYLTLGVFASSTAGSLWAPYAVVTFVLAVANLIIVNRSRL